MFKKESKISGNEFISVTFQTTLVDYEPFIAWLMSKGIRTSQEKTESEWRSLFEQWSRR